jgi:hypothetical protein
MVDHKNNEITQAIRTVTNLNDYVDKIPTKIADEIVPIVNVTPQMNRITNITGSVSKNVTGSATIITTSSTLDTYIESYSISYIKDATCDQAIGAGAFIQATVGGTSIFLGTISTLTLTAQETMVTHTLAHPIKIDRGTTVLITGSSYSVGLCSRSGCVQGYTVDPSIYSNNNG